MIARRHTLSLHVAELLGSAGFQPIERHSFSWQLTLKNGILLEAQARIDGEWLCLESEVALLSGRTPWELLLENARLPGGVKIIRRGKDAAARIRADIPLRANGETSELLADQGRRLLAAASALAHPITHATAGAGGPETVDLEPTDHKHKSIDPEPTDPEHKSIDPEPTDPEHKSVDPEPTDHEHKSIDPEPTDPEHKSFDLESVDPETADHNHKSFDPETAYLEAVDFEAACELSGWSFRRALEGSVVVTLGKRSRAFRARLEPAPSGRIRGSVPLATFDALDACCREAIGELLLAASSRVPLVRAQAAEGEGPELTLEATIPPLSGTGIDLLCSALWLACQSCGDEVAALGDSRLAEAFLRSCVHRPQQNKTQDQKRKGAIEC